MERQRFVETGSDRIFVQLIRTSGGKLHQREPAGQILCWLGGRSESTGSLDADCFPRAAAEERQDESVRAAIRGNRPDCAGKWDQVWLNPDCG